MVEKKRWNENCPRVTGRRPFVCETKRSACEAEKGPLVDERSVREPNVLCDDCHCKYWFKEYVSVSGQENYAGAGVIENENGPCARRIGPRITGHVFTRKKSSTSSVQRSVARDIKWLACACEC